MDAAAQYRHLLTLGREEFLAAAAPAVLVRYRAAAAGPVATETMTGTFEYELGPEVATDLATDLGETVDDASLRGRVPAGPVEMDLYPLAKKPGASFRDRITIGRTANNDVVIADHSVSRLHAYVRVAEGWRIADAGSKNGSWLDDVELEPRREAALPNGSVVKLGDVRLTFYLSADLFDMLGGDHGRR
jgi:pSer/pThr/pTyr-binding forkhead associated (FHA) protein